VQGVNTNFGNGWNTISLDNIKDVLTKYGRGGEPDLLRLSSHSRGSLGLRETLARKLLAGKFVDKINILDESDSFAFGKEPDPGVPGDIAPFVDPKNSGLVAKPAVNFYRVIGKDLGGVTERKLGKQSWSPADWKFWRDCMAAIGYSRLILDMLPLRPELARPAGILDPFPARGKFTTKDPAPKDLTNILDYCGLLDPTKSDSSGKKEKITAALKLKDFVNDYDLLRIDESFHLDLNIAAHHLFVAEIAHELFE
jgi:hypothetical protein